MRQRLIRYLNSYRVAVARLNDLRHRREKLKDTLDGSLHGLNYDGMPKAKTVTDGMDRVANAIDKLAEIEQELARQEQEAKDYAAAILATICLLPEGSDGRRALELRFIDGVTTLDACDKLAVSERTYWRIYHGALDSLLSFESVKAILEEMEANNGKENTTGF